MNTGAQESQPPQQSEYENYYAQVGKNQPYNFVLHIVEGIVSSFGWPLFDSEMILAVYVGLMTDSRFLVALPGTLGLFAGGASTLLFGYFVQRFNTRLRLTVLSCALNRACLSGVWLSAFLLPFVGTKWCLIILFSFLILNIPASGFGGITWSDLMGRLIMPGFRGRFWGIRNAVGMGCCAVALWTVGQMLPKEHAVAHDYQRVFLVGTIFFWITVFIISLSREAPYPRHGPARSYGEFWSSMFRRIRRDAVLRNYLYARIIAAGSVMFGLSLFSDYARRRFGIEPAVIASRFAVVLFLARAAASPAAGWIGDRKGFRILVVLGAVFTSCALAVGVTLPLWGEHAIWGFLLICFLFGVGGASDAVGSVSMSYEFGAVEERQLILAIVGGLPMFAYLIMRGMGGWLVDLYGYQPVLIVTVLLSLVSTFWFLFFVSEPPGEHGPPRRTR